MKEYLVTRALRILFSFVYLLSFIRIWVNFDGIFSIISELLDFLFLSSNYQAFMIIGKPSLLIVILIIIMAIGYTVHKKRKYLLIIIALLTINNFQGYIRPYAIVSYIDVGQGDATLIALPFNRGNILIDTGGNISYDVGKNIVFPVVSSYGIRSLDAVILTHDDYDHVGGYESLSKMMFIKKTIRDKNAEYRAKDFVLYDLLADYQFDEGNANSLTAYFEIYGTTFLVLGDIGVNQEGVLVSDNGNLHVDVLKLAHHGSKTSSSDKLLQITKPTLAIISAGRNNRYRHPAIEVTKRLDSYLIPYLNTGYSGAIEINVFASGYFVHTTRREFAIIINR